MALHQGPAAGTPVAETPPVCWGWLCSSSMGPSWEQRVGSSVSSTWLSIRSALRKAAQRNPTAVAADACREENQGKSVTVQLQRWGFHCTALPLARGGECGTAPQPWVFRGETEWDALWGCCSKSGNQTQSQEGCFEHGTMIREKSVTTGNSRSCFWVHGTPEHPQNGRAQAAPALPPPTRTFVAPCDVKGARARGGKAEKSQRLFVLKPPSIFADISQAAAAMPLVGRRSYLGNAGLRTMRAAGEEVGFNLTGHVCSSPLTFGLSETYNEGLSGEEGAAGASPAPRLLWGPCSPIALQCLAAAASHGAEPGQGFLTP